MKAEANLYHAFTNRVISVGFLQAKNCFCQQRGLNLFNWKITKIIVQWYYSFGIRGFALYLTR